MKRLFSGVKPTGDLHLGNYLGAIRQWVKLQDQYQAVYGIVDYHAMTAKYEPQNLQENVFKCACNYLACGLDPNKSILMIQSHVKYHAELTWMLNCLTPVSWLERVPTYKDKCLQQADNINVGLLDYPALMTADIIIYKAEVVPVGDDQVPHLELAREIVRRFNSTFGHIFPEPQAIVGKRIKGLDGNDKMGKSLDNCIYLYETKDQIWAKISKAMTDPARIKKTDPGNPEVCNIFTMHKILSTELVQQDVIEGCTKATIGCLECKRWLTDAVEQEIAPIREKYLYYMSNPHAIAEIYIHGNEKANKLALETMTEVYEKIGFEYEFLK
ncbi:MAG: tryptophan--tRNA ligase [Candidatus Cloacimonetes bacterium]|nr:tryptophan--tRNA ligase [Candidatus Cloacimonadota bacterium]